MKVTVIPAREFDAQLVRTWRELQDSNPQLASPYFSPEFTQTVAAVRDDGKVAVIDDAGKTAAFFPFQRSGPVGIPIGGILSDFQGLVCAPGFQLDPLKLVKQCGLSAWDFDHLLASQPCFAQHHRQLEPSPQMDLSGGFEAYCDSQRVTGSQKTMQSDNAIRPDEHEAGCVLRIVREAQRKYRRFEREVGPLSFVSHCADAAILGKVLAWKSQQYLETSNTDLFRIDWIRELVERIHVMQSPSFAGRLSVLYSGDRPVAGHLGMLTSTVWHYWFPSYDPEFSLYSPGLLLLLKMAEQAPSLGVRVIDLGKGMAIYKQRLMNASVDVASGSVELPSWLSFQRGARRRLRSLVVASPMAGPARRAVRSIRGER